MVGVLMVFAILIAYDLQRLIRQKEKARVFIVHILFMAVSLIVSLILVTGEWPENPTRWLKEGLKMMGVEK